MKTRRLHMAIAIGVAALGVCAMQPAMAANLSISINQPGVYGRVDMGEPVPQVAWVNPSPVIIMQPAVNYQRQPIYLYVPPAHSSNWGSYCRRYHACAQPVVFVRDGWVRDRYAQGRRLGHDRDCDGDGIRNSRDRDRDGDGVHNSRDGQPNNPYRR